MNIYIYIFVVVVDVVDVVDIIDVVVVVVVVVVVDVVDVVDVIDVVVDVVVDVVDNEPADWTELRQLSDQHDHPLETEQPGNRLYTFFNIMHVLFVH